ncbi:uncharacterized protein LOC117113393, partial [Anneissia japonica]|uniref:uncharacterized protein LOC117113393 n=1 Tax=Anneissia japonica TaxID=1529436 RepID=UPI00142566D5
MSSSSSSHSIEKNIGKKVKSDFNVRALLENSHVGRSIIAEIDSDGMTRKSRLQFVRIVVAEIINHFGDRPSCEVKKRMARAIIEEFPSLKDDEGHGFEAWYTPGKGRHSATGWIEERLRNVRRSYVKPISSTSSSSSSLVSATLQ